MARLGFGDAVLHKTVKTAVKVTARRPQQGSKLEPVELALQQTKVKPFPAWFRRERLYPSVSDLYILVGTSGHARISCTDSVLLKTYLAKSTRRQLVVSLIMYGLILMNTYLTSGRCAAHGRQDRLTTD